MVLPRDGYSVLDSNLDFSQEESKRSAVIVIVMTKSVDIIAENDFVREVLVKDIREPLDILNWYRNLYYKESIITERGLMAMTINDLFMKYNFTLR